MNNEDRLRANDELEEVTLCIANRLDEITVILSRDNARRKMYKNARTPFPK